MRNFYFIGFVFFAFAVNAQNVARVVNYQPAPGQHINLEQTGTPQAAQNMADDENSLVSLGGFGGYAVLKFDAPCQNEPENPYGIDFTIFGNAFSGSSESGVVWVMKDKNQNGKPDDTWYEIAGSGYYHPLTIKDYRVTYTKTGTRDVAWFDNFGNRGKLKANSFNTQEYYPMPQFFPDYPQDSVSFSGTKLFPFINDSDNKEIKISPLEFGYADNHPKIRGMNLTVPDNPYTAELEGAGGDPVDISWAVDSLGNYVDLDEIHFVKIVTGYLADLGRLGEASTDISYVVDVEKNPSVGGQEELLVFYPLLAKKITIGDSLAVSALLFKNGKPTKIPVTFQSENSSVAAIGSSNTIYANQVGTTEIIASANGLIKKQQLKVVSIDSVNVTGNFSAVYPGDTILLEVQFLDNNGENFNIKPDFSLSNQAVGKIIEKDRAFYFIAENSGAVTLTCKNERFEIQDNIEIKVLSENEQIYVYFSLQTEYESIYPLQWMNVGISNFNEFVENRQQEYSEISRITLAHAIFTGLQNAEVNYSFRDDENSDGKLYLYSVENDGLFSYGWGGKTEPVAFARSWIARLNNTHYLNDFDKIKIADGDTISLYHISNITSPWKFSRILSSADSAASGSAIKLIAEEAVCALQNDSIVQSDFSPVKNLEISGAEEAYFTDETGTTEVILDGNPPWIFTSGNNAVLIINRQVTAAAQNDRPDFKLFPNPATQVLTLQGSDIKNAAIQLVTINGKIIRESVSNSDVVKIDIRNLKPGFYFLRIKNKSAVKTAKFLKQ